MELIRPDFVDLTPLLDDPAAAEALMRARGQLNRAFRSHGLESPDKLRVADPSAADPGDLDDPACLGVEEALFRFEEDFLTWSRRMPRALVAPVLEILRRASQAPGERGPGAELALLSAFTFLSERAAAVDR